MKHARIQMLAMLASVLLCGRERPARMAAEGSLEYAYTVYAQCVAAQGAGSAQSETSRQNYGRVNDPMIKVCAAQNSSLRTRVGQID
jgi:hypothetical protein